MSASENPPAFPLALPAGFESAEPGMTLRDWFAGQALAGICATTDDDRRDQTDWSIEASDAYDAADAMLAARQDRAS